MKKIPIDVSSFEILRSEGYTYVDKTKQIYDIITGGRLYFLSRPRRFGKSLLISTLSELFLGKKELFKGLWIEQKSDYSWNAHPVVHLDFSIMPIKSGEALEKAVSWDLEETGRHYGLDVSAAPDISSKLKLLLTKLAEEKRVVILIDEHDYGLVNNINNKEKALEIHAVLREFYSSLKGLDKYIQFLFITGVTKFSKTSLFSGLNNLNDLSLDPRASDLLGYSREEIEHNFPGPLKALAEAHEGIDLEEIFIKLQAWYNGYRFSENAQYVYNPFSVLYCLMKKRFANYWFETGAPAFLIGLLKKHHYQLEDISKVEFTADTLGPFEIGEEPLIPILFQAGYLTINEYHRTIHNNEITEYYTLKYPNLEVEESVKKYLRITDANNLPKYRRRHF